MDSMPSPGLASPNGAKLVQRQRRSTGSNKSVSSNKGSDGTPEEEDPQTKERINAILEMAKKEEEANKKIHPFSTTGPNSQASTIITSIPSTAGGSNTPKTIITPVTMPGTPHLPVAVTPQMASAKAFAGLIQPLPSLQPQSLVQVI